MENKPRGSFCAGFTIAWEKPKTAIGCLVRMINTAPQFGFLVFLPTFFTTAVGLRLSQWLQLLSYMFLSNIIANLLSGIVGDKLGWRRTVAYVWRDWLHGNDASALLRAGCTPRKFRAGRRGFRSLRGDPCWLRPAYRHHAALGAGKQRCRHLDANPRGGCKRYAWSGDRRRLHWTARS